MPSHLLALLGVISFRFCGSERVYSNSEDFNKGAVDVEQGYPQPYVDYITGCSGNGDCYFDPRRGCHCDGHNCLVEGERHPDPHSQGVFAGANKFCVRNTNVFSKDWCECDQAAVMRAERNTRYRARLLEQQEGTKTPAEILQTQEATLKAKWKRMKDADQVGNHNVPPEFAALASQDRIVSVFHVCTEMKDIPIVDASHCGVVFRTASDTYYAEYATGSLTSNGVDGLPGSVRGRRVDNGTPLDSNGLAQLMWSNGHAPMIKSMDKFKVLLSDRSLSGRNMSPFQVAKWMIDYQSKYPYYSLTLRNCQYFSGELYSQIRGVAFEASRDLIDYWKLLGLQAGHAIPGMTDVLQGMGV